jgi:hypothetical protein
MKRPLLLWLILLAFSLQGSMAAFADVAPSMPSHCQTAADSHSMTSHKHCCRDGLHTADCCPDACAAVVAIPVSPPSSAAWFGRSVLIPQGRMTRFSTRGDSPLIRPPIL